MKLWPHQQYAIEQVNLNIARGIKHMCVCSPTGGGKSVIMQQLIAQIAGDQKLPVALYSPRKMLTDQLIGYCQKLHLPFGVRAAEYDHYRNDSALIQVCSALTEKSRVDSGKYDDLADAEVVFVDEAHMATNGVPRDIINRHVEKGSTIVEVTATPMGLHDHCDGNLIVAGTTSELRDCGALLPAIMYDHGEYEIKGLKAINADGEFSHKKITEAGYCKHIYASALREFRDKNPEMLPSLFCAPGVAESKWFVDQFNKDGITAGHIDGEDIYLNGKEYKKDFKAKEELIEMHRCGDVVALWNRFVLREGIDLPWVYYLGLCCPIGSLKSYIQVCGRALRNFRDYDHVVIADHGGNIARHGSCNADWDWDELWQLSQDQITERRKKKVHDGEEDPGISCSKCGKMYGGWVPETCSCGNDLRKIYQCPVCYHEHREWPKGNHCTKCHADMRKVRRKPVIQSDGSLKRVKDDRFQKKPETNLGAKTSKMWEQIYWGYTKHRIPKSFKQARAWFNKLHMEKFGCRPPQDGLPFMPKDPIDWYRKVKDVPRKDLF